MKVTPIQVLEQPKNIEILDQNEQLSAIKPYKLVIVAEYGKVD